MRPAHVGCSGWNYNDWRGGLYPASEPRRRGQVFYAEHFDTVEVNTTFYRLLNRDSVATWVRDTPDTFIFAVKASRYLTHVKRLTDLGQGVRRFYERIEPLIESRRLGPVLWQLPANFHRDDDRLSAWLEALPEGRHTIEIRHPSWFVAPAMARLRERDVALTIGDHPERPFQSHAATADWRFVRFHYGHSGRGGNYSATELQTWVRRIAQWRRRTEVFAYFKNDWRGYAPANACELARRLGR